MSRIPGRRLARRPIAICVPVRNEAERLPRLLSALERLDVSSAEKVHVCLLLDECTDASAAIAEAYRTASRHRVHIGEAASGDPNAGKARGRAMSLGLAACDRSDGILLSTDADSWPQADWLTAMVGALAVSDVVVGDVKRHGDHPAGAPDRLDRYYAGLFAMRRRIDPVPWDAADTHHHASGANMGMRAETYRQLGGYRPIPNGEDALLVDDAGRAGFRVRRDAASVVVTSDRRRGRARHGLAETLRDLDCEGLETIMVAHPIDQVWQYRAHRVARDAFEPRRFTALTALIGLDADHLLGVARDCPNAEAFAMRVVPVPPGGMRQVTFATAEALLAGLVSSASPARAA